jgi:hypothetical protein
MSSDSLDTVFQKLLMGAEAGSASPRPRPAAKRATYAQAYEWRLHSFVAQKYVVTCECCKTTKITGGDIFKKVVSTRSANVISMTRIASLKELDSHPSLPRLLEVHQSMALACYDCIVANSFNKEYLNGQA